VLDTLASKEGGAWKTDAKIKADIATIQLKGEKVLLVKPLSFYNETGQVARALVDFYKLNPAEDFLVIHDELALPFGTVRVRQKGSDAGNNGVKSLNAHLGPDYARIRIGVWNERRDQMDDAAFVLSVFTAEEQEALAKLITNPILPLIDEFISGSLAASSHKLT
jgi:PTH1 family peptidyl-tRNA hydrolase